MKNAVKVLKMPLTGIFLLAMITAVALASDGPRLRPRHRGGNGGGYSVAEPAAIALLATGLVSLGVYAKRKRNKK
jgi:hypothetical protein